MPDALLDPAVLSAIGDLELVARVTVDGTVSGLHRSPFHGYSAEFSQYRHYRPGDDLKYVDWKLFARTDRLYTKQYRETTNMPAQVAVDASASMAYQGTGPVSKLAYARLLAAAVSHLLSGQGDAVGLVTFADALRDYIPSRSGRLHLRRILVALTKLDASGTTSGANALRRADRSAEAPRTARPGVGSVRRRGRGRVGAAPRGSDRARGGCLPRPRAATRWRCHSSEMSSSRISRPGAGS